MSKANAVRMTEQGSFTIPAELRRELGLKPGQQFAVVPKGDSITLVPIRSLEELEGIAAGKDYYDTYRDRRWC